MPAQQPTTDYAPRGPAPNPVPPRLTEALRAGLIFGVIEAITPMIGWAIGHAATRWVEDWDHWIAFTLLVGLGLHMIWNGLKADDEEAEKPTQHSFMILAVTAFATSIDALAVGVGLAFVDVNILVAAAALLINIAVRDRLRQQRVMQRLEGEKTGPGKFDTWMRAVGNTKFGQRSVFSPYRRCITRCCRSRSRTAILISNAAAATINSAQITKAMSYAPYHAP